jgi:hypothetical protein
MEVEMKVEGWWCGGVVDAEEAMSGWKREL